MSILVVGPDRRTDRAIIDRLVAEGDDVRVVTDRSADAAEWKSAGAHVAVGELTDTDLIERAAQGCRTVVVIGGYEDDPILQGARGAGVTRAIVLIRTLKRAAVVLERTETIHQMEYVLLTTRRGRFPLSPPIESEAIAEAVSAADDLAGNPELVVDLASTAGRRLLGLESS